MSEFKLDPDSIAKNWNRLLRTNYIFRYNSDMTYDRYKKNVIFRTIWTYLYRKINIMSAGIDKNVEGDQNLKKALMIRA